MRLLIRQLSITRVYYLVALIGALLSGTYYFIVLRQACGVVPLLTCIKQSVRLAPQEPPSISPSKPADNPSTASGSHSSSHQTAAAEAMLIWTGHLDGEVGRISKGEFDKAVKEFQKSVGASVANGDLLSSQYVVLGERFWAIRKRWQFQRVQNPKASELWLPVALLPDSEELKYGHRYESDDTNFSVDVAQLPTPEWTLERLKNFHCCKILPDRKLEQPIRDYSDSKMKGFLLSVTDGKNRISVRAFEKDSVIRLLAITYNLDRDKEFRTLRNVIGSNYRPFELP